MESIYNFLQISNLIATSGQPTEEQFSAVKNSGYQVVINLGLISSSRALSNEKQLVHSLGMEYIHIPVVWDKPEITEFSQFASVMQVNSDKKVFVHCIANKRVSAFMYLFRYLCQGMTPEDIEKDLHKIWIPNDIWQQFIGEVIAKYS
ncbi:phosphatase [Mastigocoleus testarum BC008]|uniref:Phosphatase n=1 Tax=Mastigocoleus testarum BC008 TaxID=371196 RepID=A0A0V7ZSK8_9CYAN|nr:phosphatase [Mastigocoleus testarum BC008]